MRKPGIVVVLLGIALIASGTVSADHVIHFKSGSSMAIRAYRMDAGMVHVDLGGNAFMAFPEQLVETIENPTRSLNLKPSTLHPDDHGPMRAASATSGGGGARRGGGAKKDSYQPPTSRNPGVIGKPQAAVNPGQPQVSGAWRGNQGGARGFDPAAASINNTSRQGSLRGAQRVGNKHVLPGHGKQPERRVNIELRDGNRVLPPGFNPPNSGAEPPESSGGSSGESGE